MGVTRAGPEVSAWAGSPAAACRTTSLARRRCKMIERPRPPPSGTKAMERGVGRSHSPGGARPTAGHSLGEMELTPGRHGQHRAQRRSPSRHSAARRCPKRPGVRRSPRGRGPTSRRSLRDALLRRGRKSRPTRRKRPARMPATPPPGRKRAAPASG